jgi:copper ion binding protein
MSVQTTYDIKGMTCGHCVHAVSTELGGLIGVHDVAVDLEGGTALVTSDAPLPIDEVRNAVDEAGYELVGIRG